MTSPILKTILVPTDFSESAEAALDYAIRLGSALGTKTIYLLHAYTIPVVPGADGMALSADAMGSILRGSEEALRNLTDKRKDVGIELRTMAKTGDARDLILAVAAEVQADLVCMGTHGRRGLSHLLIGSVAEAVVRTSTVPVLTVRTPHFPAKK